MSSQPQSFVGTETVHTETISSEEVETFSEVTGDDNPLHLEEEYAKESMFGERIVHGALLNGYVSSALNKIPGDIIYLSQSAQFENPAYLGETVTATCSVVEDLGEGQFRIETIVQNEAEEVLVSGEAIILRA